MSGPHHRRYEITAAIGEGGFGTVYLARLHGGGGFSKQIALKVLKPEKAETDEIATRLRDEARILGHIRHRAVVHVDGLVRVAGRWAVVMEYIEGVDLRAIARTYGPMPVGPVLDVIGEISGALHVAYHTSGPEGRPLRLLHRDIKPANIKVTSAGEVKVLDFGVARADFDAREAETRAVRFGSAGYLAPERLTGTDSAAGDVYALGVVMVELLTARRYGPTEVTPEHQAVQVDDRVGGLVTFGVPPEVNGLLREMLAWEAAARPSSREVEKRLAALRQGLGRSGPGEPIRDWAEREIPALARRIAAREPVTGDLVGRTLEEELSAVGGPAPIGNEPTMVLADPHAATVLQRRSRPH
ncbi:MAG: serine/threonine protein kinase, partial [Deltaproteobacteria bacterium]|nr:serine/threonine protein kinase [Deltaproteobacteria bacterium]